jgi:hypothetical protein
MPPHPGYARPLTVSVQTADPDEARVVCGEHLYPHSMRLLDPSAGFNARFSFLHLGGLTLGDLRFRQLSPDCADRGNLRGVPGWPPRQRSSGASGRVSTGRGVNGGLELDLVLIRR